MREKIAVVQHIDPYLPIINQLGSKSFLDDLPRCNRRNDKAAFFKKVLHRFPCQLERILEPLDDPFLFEKRKRRATVLQGISQQAVCSFEVLIPLYPSNVCFVRHTGSLMRMSGLCPTEEESGHKRHRKE